MSLDQYQQTQTTVERPREMEYRAFSKVTARLIEAAQKSDDERAFINNAVHENRQFWLALAQDCASDKNLLPLETRATIVHLSRWISQYSREILRRGDSIEPLIDVNRIMMDGLAGRAPSDDAA